jgi:hypothetical protein
MSSPSENRSDPRDEVSLAEVALGALRFLRDFARLIVPLSLLLAVAAGALTAFRPEFQAHAILDTPKLSLDEWRRLVPVLHDPPLVAGTLATMNLPRREGTEADERERLRLLFERPGFWSRQAQYRSALQREDIREVPNADLRAASTLGVELSLRATSRTSAAIYMDAAARHIAQSLLWSALDGFWRDQNSIATGQKSMLELRLTKLAFEMEQNRARSADMRRLMEAFPERPETAGGTIVSPENGGSRFLSPFAQWVALETKASEMQADIRAARYDLEKLGWLDRFLTATRDRRGDVRSGFVLAGWLEDRKNEVFASATTPAALQAREEISFAIAEARARAERIGFTAAPVIDGRPVWTRSPLPVALAVFFAAVAVLSVLLAFYKLFRTLDRPKGDVWVATRDPLFAWLPFRLRLALFPYEPRSPADKGA